MRYFRILIIAMLIGYYTCKMRKDDDSSIPEVDDPCDTHFCRDIEIIEHDVQVPEVRKDNGRR